MSRLFIGTAGWTIPHPFAEYFGGGESHLERYTTGLNSVEINSSFYRHHEAKTYQRWAASVPKDFRFSVKLSRFFTQEKKLLCTRQDLSEALRPIAALGEKWGCLLIQLPPSLKFDVAIAGQFFENLRSVYSGPTVLEPRHVSWSEIEAQELLATFQIFKVLSDPERCAMPIKKENYFNGVLYLRLHGSPEIYRSLYESDVLSIISDDIQKYLRWKVPSIWCIFDNTTFGYATKNAFELRTLIGNSSGLRSPLGS